MDDLTNETNRAMQMQKTTPRITGTVGLALIAYAVLSASPVDADTTYTSVLEFNELSRDEQFPIVRSALSAIYEHYSEREPNKAVADCIIDLFNNPDRETNGYDHFGIALQVALSHENPSDYSVESILVGIINAQCPLASGE